MRNMKRYAFALLLAGVVATATGCVCATDPTVDDGTTTNESSTRDNNQRETPNNSTSSTRDNGIIDDIGEDVSNGLDDIGNDISNGVEDVTDGTDDTTGGNTNRNGR